MRRPRRSRFLPALIVVAALVNLPWLHSSWVSYQLSRNGEDVTATVVGHRASGALHHLEIKLPASVDPQQPTRGVEVQPSAYDAAVQAGTIAVRVLPDDPSQLAVEGEVGDRAVAVLTLVVDGLLLVAVLLLAWARRSTPERLRLLAMEDLRRAPPGGPPGGSMEQVAPETYLVRGEGTEIAEDRIVLDLDGTAVEVLLNGYRNPVGHQQPAQVHARLG